MIDKTVRSMAEAVHSICDGHTVLIGGFGSVGRANHSIEGLIEHGAKDLVCVVNNAGNGHSGLARLLELGRLRGEEMRQYFEVTRIYQESCSEIRSRSERPASKTAGTR
jgi:acyl CoA:acetate/3-ketoacid CoA transferase alpha subunit